MTEHPITPPPELIQRWSEQFEAGRSLYAMFEDIYRAGADAELEACCEWVDWKWSGIKSRELRASRRPKPPSLKETLLAQVARIPGEGADAAYLRHWVDNESQRLVDLLHEVFKSLPD
jgi:hypothetical protein